MSCPKDTNILTRDEFGNLIAPNVRRISKCKGKKPVYPSFTPVIDSISVNSSISGVYTVVVIQGSNFLPPCNGETYVNFGSYKKIPITFYSTSTISFVVPLSAISGTYTITVVNIYNGNFSLPVNQSYPGIPNYSNTETFTIYNVEYVVSGSYTISSDSNYNTIINFTGNGTFTLYQNINHAIINYTAVGGGGGGAGGIYAVGAGGGGGGGGEVAFGTFTSPNSYVVLVGAGGNGGLSDGTFPQNGSSGGSSQISGIVSVAGGQGGKSKNSGSNGGNSGHGGAGGTGNTNPGGNGTNGGGGGGGAYGVPTGYHGGNGAASTTSVYNYGTSFGAGGGGGGGGSGTPTNSTSGIGGNIYAGNGGQPNIPGNAVANYGGGGGGGLSGNGAGGSYSNGGRGGSGRVIIFFNN